MSAADITTSSMIDDDDDVLKAFKNPKAFPYYDLFVTLEGIFGLIGNALVLAVFFKHKKLLKMSSSFFLLHQTAADLVCSVMILVVYCYKWKPVRYLDGALGEILCLLIESEMMLWSSLTASTLGLVLVTMERYFKIVHPILHHNYYSKRICWISIAIVWTLGLLWNVVPTILTTHIQDGGCWFYYFWPSAHARKTFGLVYLFLGSYFGPIIIFAFAYGRMLRVLKKVGFKTSRPEFTCDGRSDTTASVTHTANTSQENNPAADVNHRKQHMGTAQRNVFRTLIIVTLAFVICWTPNQMFYLLDNFGIYVGGYGTFYNISVFMAFGNSCINPIIYVLKYDEFKVGLRKLLNIV